MTNHAHATVGCHLVGEYVDEAEVPTDVSFHRGEVVRPRLAAHFLDQWNHAPGASESLSVALVRVFQQESHGPSRARMLESIVKLQAIETIREFLGRQDTTLHAQSALISLGKMFGSTDDESLRMLAAMLARQQDREE